MVQLVFASPVFASPVFACPDLWVNVSAVSQHRDLTSFISAHEGQHLLRSALMVRIFRS